MASELGQVEGMERPMFSEGQRAQSWQGLAFSENTPASMLEKLSKHLIWIGILAIFKAR